MKRTLALLAALAVALPVAAQEGTLKKIKDSGAITIGHRDASLPFSYYDDKQQPIGYSMDICSKVVDAVKAKPDKTFNFATGEQTNPAFGSISGVALPRCEVRTLGGTQFYLGAVVTPYKLREDELVWRVDFHLAGRAGDLPGQGVGRGLLVRGASHCPARGPSTARRTRDHRGRRRASDPWPAIHRPALSSRSWRCRDSDDRV